MFGFNCNGLLKGYFHNVITLNRGTNPVTIMLKGYFYEILSKIMSF